MPGLLEDAYGQPSGSLLEDAYSSPAPQSDFLTSVYGDVAPSARSGVAGETRHHSVAEHAADFVADQLDPINLAMLAASFGGWSLGGKLATKAGFSALKAVGATELGSEILAPSMLGRVVHRAASGLGGAIPFALASGIKTPKEGQTRIGNFGRELLALEAFDFALAIPLGGAINKFTRDYTREATAATLKAAHAVATAKGMGAEEAKAAAFATILTSKVRQLEKEVGPAAATQILSAVDKLASTPADDLARMVAEQAAALRRDPAAAQALARMGIPESAVDDVLGKLVADRQALATKAAEAGGGATVHPTVRAALDAEAERMGATVPVVTTPDPAAQSTIESGLTPLVDSFAHDAGLVAPASHGHIPPPASDVPTVIPGFSGRAPTEPTAFIINDIDSGMPRITADPKEVAMNEMRGGTTVSSVTGEDLTDARINAAMLLRDEEARTFAKLAEVPLSVDVAQQRAVASQTAKLGLPDTGLPPMTAEGLGEAAGESTLDELTLAAQQDPLAGSTRMLPNGHNVTIGTDTSGQLRLTLDPPPLAEALDSPEAASRRAAEDAATQQMNRTPQRKGPCPSSEVI